MPEGPEIRRVADRLGQQLQGRRLDHVWFSFSELQVQASSLIGRKVSSVDCWGKALLIHFDDQRTLYSHNQLYGVWKLHRRDRPPSTRRSLRVSLAAGQHAASLYSASDVSLWQHDALADHPFLRRLGPDLLTHQVSPEDIEERLDAPQWRGRALGNSLLDQGLLAGIGNYLRSEILFFAGVAPGRRPRDLSTQERQRLARTILDITQQAYRQAGVTNRAEWVSLARQQGATRRGWRFAVFERDGKPCHACGGEIERISMASRRLYHCPRCQR